MTLATPPAAADLAIERSGGQQPPPPGRAKATSSLSRDEGRRRAEIRGNPSGFDRNRDEFFGGVTDSTAPEFGSDSAHEPRTHLRPLDGMRGLAVLAVFLFHAGLSWAPGGLLGVDVFFVLSGFLITGSLLNEHDREGRINLREFWARRARRLLPATSLLVVVVLAVWQVTVDPSLLSSLRRDAVSTLAYVANWRFAFSGQDYFAHFAPPSPLLHMWSLGVEEQFYLLWPLLLLLLLRGRHGARARRRVLVASLGLAVVTAVWCSVLATQGVNSSRLYYGTDTRAPALLVGSAIACLLWLAPVVAPRRVAPHPRCRSLGRKSLSFVGILALGALTVAVALVNGQSAWLYHGGFVGVACAAGCMLASVLVSPGGALSRLFSLPPLVWLGRISYGVYLWHWPVLLFVTEQRTGLTNAPLLALRAAATLGVAALSWFALERPVVLRRVRIPRAGFVAPLLTAGLVLAALAAPLPRIPGGGTPDFNSIGRSSEIVTGPAPSAARLGSPPTRVLLLGDSVALTLGEGLRRTAPVANVVFANRGTVGCGVVSGGPIRISGRVEQEPRDCSFVLQNWLDQTRAMRPDVVAVMVGRWEVYDRFYEGRFRAPGDPVYDAHLLDLLNSALHALLSRHVRVVLLTPPCTRVHETPSGAPAMEDDPTRRIRFTQLLSDAAQQHASAGVKVVDVGGRTCPGGNFSRTDAEGHVIRTNDGIHLTPQAGVELGAELFSELKALSRQVPLPG